MPANLDEDTRLAMLASYGPVNVVISRAINAEETIHAQIFGKTYAEIAPQVRKCLEDIRRHMRNHNKRVVLNFQQNLREIEAQIREQMDLKRTLDVEIEELVQAKARQENELALLSGVEPPHPNLPVAPELANGA